MVFSSSCPNPTPSMGPRRRWYIASANGTSASGKGAGDESAPAEKASATRETHFSIRATDAPVFFLEEADEPAPTRSVSSSCASSTRRRAARREAVGKCTARA
jgi:hypothetical protein